MHAHTIRKHNLLFNKLNDNQDDQIHEMMKIKISKCQMHLGVKNNMTEVEIQRK